MEVIGPILAFVILTPLSLLALSGLFSALILLFPEPIRQARENLENRPWRSIFLGTLNFIGGGVIAMLVVWLGNALDQDALDPIFIGLLLLISAAMAIPIVIGLSAMIILIGDRLGKTRTPFITYLRGGGLLLLACLTPFIGWLVFTPLIVWASLGSVIAILVKPKKAPAAMDKTDNEASSVTS
jgi:hypothetical protein